MEVVGWSKGNFFFRKS